MKGFIEFIRKQGVMGLAIGFIMGGSITKMVTSLVTDIINPAIGILLGGANGLAEKAVTVHNVKILWGSFVSNILDFLIIALIIYTVYEAFKLEKLGIKIEAKK